MSIVDQTLNSLRWLAIGRFSSQILTWAITLIVIRLLTPLDYGLMSLAMMVIGIGEIFREAGLSSAIIQSSDYNNDIGKRIFGFVFLLNLFIYFLFLLSTPLVVKFFSNSKLASILPIVSLQFIVGSFAVIPNALISRGMLFKKKAILVFFTSILTSLTTLSLALLGAGVWALICGNLFGLTVQVFGSIYITQFWCLPSFNFKGLGQYFKFGGGVTAGKVVWYLYSQADIFIAGKVLGVQLLGFYSVARELAALPMAKFSAIINEVGFASFSKIQNDSQTLKKHFCQAMEIVGFFSFPVFWGISSIAPEIVSVCLGVAWVEAVLPLQILGIIMPLRMLSNSMSPAVLALGKVRLGLTNIIIGSFIMVPAFYVGSRWGLAGLSYAWLIGFPMFFLVRLVRTLPYLGLRLFEYFSYLSFSLVSSAVMYLSVYSMRILLKNYETSQLIQMFVLIFTGVIVFSAINLLGRKNFCFYVISLVRR